ncbi:MAG TPA: nucleotidyltransferase domain-containing protein [Thermoanaerobaculia bacterium]|nr:nucleotidyltransferase domain-containing protein [Thermoanaerobaculia bacterium]
MTTIAQKLAIEIPRDQLRDFCRRWKITEFSLFGSVTKPEEFRSDSDVDVMIEFASDAKWSLFNFAHMKDELATIFGREVDLVTRYSVERDENRFRRRNMLSSAVPLEFG